MGTVFGGVGLGVPDSMELKIESVDSEARGVARHNDKVIFVNDALPREVVDVEIRKKKSNYETGLITDLKARSSSRQTPKCPSFGICG